MYYSKLETNRLVKIAGRIIIGIILCSCSESKVSEKSDHILNVYVCTGPQSHCYHFDSLCVAFNRCTGERIEMALDSAVTRYDACGFCVKRDKELVCEKFDTITDLEKKEVKIDKKLNKNKIPERILMEEEIK